MQKRLGRIRSAVATVAAALFLVALAPARGQVYVVDSNALPGADFTDLQVAVDTVADGDVLLLRSGFYGDVIPFGGGAIDIDGKGLSLVEEAGAVVNMGTINLSNLVAGQTVVLRGFDFYDGAALNVTNCASVVWVEDCHFDFNINGSSIGITATGAAALHLNRCEILCAQGIGASIARVHLIDSNVSCYDTLIVGCDANPFAPSATGGVYQEGGFLYSSGSFLQGGAGCGGSGLTLAGRGPEARILDSTVAAGFCTGGQPDVDIQAGAYTLSYLAGTAHHFEVNGPVRAGEQVVLTLEGVPGELAFLDASLRAGRNDFPFLTGIWQLSLPYIDTFALGPVPASGELVVNLTFGSVATYWEIFLQADFFDPVTTKLTLAGGSYLLALAP